MQHLKHGDMVTCKINTGNKTYCIKDGRITIEENDIFICQDKISGTFCKNTQGYKHSWFAGIIKDGVISDTELAWREVYELEVVPEYVKLEIKPQRKKYKMSGKPRKPRSPNKKKLLAAIETHVAQVSKKEDIKSIGTVCLKESTIERLRQMKQATGMDINKIARLIIEEFIGEVKFETTVKLTRTNQSKF